MHVHLISCFFFLLYKHIYIYILFLNVLFFFDLLIMEKSVDPVRFSRDAVP